MSCSRRKLGGKGLGLQLLYINFDVTVVPLIVLDLCIPSKRYVVWLRGMWKGIWSSNSLNWLSGSSSVFSPTFTPNSRDFWCYQFEFFERFYEINCVFLFTLACDSIVPGPELFPVYSVPKQITIILSFLLVLGGMKAFWKFCLLLQFSISGGSSGECVCSIWHF